MSTPAKKDKHEVAVIDFTADAGAGMEGADQDSFAIPFLQVLQKGSPQVDEADSAYVEGAKPGMFWESVTNRVFDGKAGIQFLQCAYQRRFVHWGPREGGSFKGELDPARVMQMQDNGTLKEYEGKWYFPLDDGTVHEKRCDYVADTRNHYGLVLTETGPIQVVFALSSTKIKSSKQLMSMLNQVKVNGVTPPTWASIIRITTVPESNDKGSWHGIRFSMEGLISDPELYAYGKAFHDTIGSGSARAAYESTADTTADGKF